MPGLLYDLQPTLSAFCLLEDHSSQGDFDAPLQEQELLREPPLLHHAWSATSLGLIDHGRLPLHGALVLPQPDPTTCEKGNRFSVSGSIQVASGGD